MRGKKVTRRRALQAGAGLALGAGATQAAPPETPNVYEALGLTVTNLGGSVMPPEVVAAWTQAARCFVNLLELQDRVGARIASLVGVEAAMVTTGAAGALLLGTAAAVAGSDRSRIARLPDTQGLKNEVILQRSHHSCYDNQLKDVGVRLIDVETPADVARAVNERTALMFFMNKAEPDGRIERRAWLELARQHRVPTLLDAAADVPPLERLAGYNRMGFDLVAFSGGKALRGPNDCGLLLGRRDLIDAAKRNANPHCGTIGRMMKVGKEDMVAMLAAVERFVRLDHAAQWRAWEASIGVIEQAVRAIPTVQTERIVPEIANHVPHLVVSWDEERLQLTRAQVTQALAQGSPPIQIGRVSGTGDRGILISVLTLQPGEDAIVAARLRAILGRAR